MQILIHCSLQEYPVPKSASNKKKIDMSHLMDRLLIDIYSCSSFGERTTSESKMSSWQAIRAHQRPPLQRARLELKGIK